VTVFLTGMRLRIVSRFSPIPSGHFSQRPPKMETIAVVRNFVDDVHRKINTWRPVFESTRSLTLSSGGVRASHHEVRSGFTVIGFSMACTLRSTKMTLGISIVPRSPAAVALRSAAPRPSAARKKSELSFWNRNPLVSKLSAPPAREPSPGSLHAVHFMQSLGEDGDVDRLGIYSSHELCLVASELAQGQYAKQQANM
jgi:hypothetical protein